MNTVVEDIVFMTEDLDFDGRSNRCLTDDIPLVQTQDHTALSIVGSLPYFAPVMVSCGNVPNEMVGNFKGFS
jgi:hypothetical protein